MKAVFIKRESDEIFVADQTGFNKSQSDLKTCYFEMKIQ